MRLSLSTVSLALLALGAGVIAACATPGAGMGDKPYSSAAILSANCFGCHGPEGRSPGSVPSLHKLSEKKIRNYMKDFQSGAEPSTVMGRQAKGYSDAEIDAVAKYLANLAKKK